MNMYYDENLDNLVQNATDVLSRESVEQFRDNNLKYLSIKSGISIDELLLKVPDEIRIIINTI